MEQFVFMALDYAWCIPLLPALSFAVIGLFTYYYHRLAAAISLFSIVCSFVLSMLIVLATVQFSGISLDITMNNPWVQKLTWIEIAGLKFTMGVFIDPMSAMMLAVVTTVSLLVQIYSVGYMKGDSGFGRFFAYVSLFSASMLGLNIAVNFIQMYIFWELVGLCSYLLIGFYYARPSAREAAKKAFITTRIGDFGLLVGILMLQTLFGTTDFIELSQLIPPYIAAMGTGLLSFIALLIFIGPIGKSGQFPLHVWLPDAMEGPTPVSALIHAATMVVAGVYLVARAYFLFEPLADLMTLLAWLGGFTAFFGASIAFSQREIKRILAYSTISQLGYMMLALGVGSLTASMFHLMTHAFFKALLFLGAGAVMHALNDEADIFKMGGLRKKLPIVCICMTVGVLAISGIPPFAGFFSKDEILLASSQVSMPLYILATLTAFMTTFYMARLLFVVFFGKGNHHVHAVSPFMQLPLIVLAILATVSGLIGFWGDFGEWVYFKNPVHAHLDIAVAGTSTVMSVLAFIFAWLVYGSKVISADKIAQKLGFIYTVTYHKYYIDEFYAVVRRIFLDGIGKIMYIIDICIIDGIVNGLSALILFLSKIMGKWQTGQVQRYAAVFLTGMVIFLIGTLLYVYQLEIRDVLAFGGVL